MRKNRSRFLMCLTATALAFSLFSAPVSAEENPLPPLPPGVVPDTPPVPAPAESGKAYIYSPDYCDFTATFPEEPQINTICEEKDPTACYKLASYTKVFNMVSTVQIDIICNPSNKKLYDAMTKERMIETVKSMTKDVVLKTHESNARDNEGYRQAGLVGLSKMGMDESIFVAQLWSSENSLLSVKAQLIGQQMDASDELFAKIMKTIGYKKDFSAPQKKAPAPEAMKEEPKEEKESKAPAPKP